MECPGGPATDTENIWAHAYYGLGGFPDGPLRGFPTENHMMGMGIGIAQGDWDEGDAYAHPHPHIGPETGGKRVACLKELFYFPEFSGEPQSSFSIDMCQSLPLQQTARDLGSAPLAIISATENQFGEDIYRNISDDPPCRACFELREARQFCNVKRANFVPPMCFVIEERWGKFWISSRGDRHMVTVRPSGSTGPDLDGNLNMRAEYGWKTLETGFEYELNSGDIFEIRSTNHHTHHGNIYMFVEGASSDAIRKALGAERKFTFGDADSEDSSADEAVEYD